MTEQEQRDLERERRRLERLRVVVVDLSEWRHAAEDEHEPELDPDEAA